MRQHAPAAAEAPPRTPLWELTALPQTPYLDLREGRGSGIDEQEKGRGKRKREAGGGRRKRRKDRERRKGKDREKWEWTRTNSGGNRRPCQVQYIHRSQRVHAFSSRIFL